MIVDAAEDAVQKRNQCDESDEHGADVQREMKSVGSAFGDRTEDVGFLLLFAFAVVKFHFRGGGFRAGHFASTGERNFSFGNENFRHQNSAGGGHDDGAQQEFRADAECDVRSHDAARDMGHAGGHDGHQLRAS